MTMPTPDRGQLGRRPSRARGDAPGWVYLPASAGGRLAGRPSRAGGAGLGVQGMDRGSAASVFAGVAGRGTLRGRRIKGPRREGREVVHPHVIFGDRD